MNNQQAINLLKGLEQSLDDYCELNDEGKTAFGMAITALELFGNSEQLPSAQPDEEKISDLLYDVYRLTCPQLGTGGVAVLKSYISMVYREIFGEEGPEWMR